MGKHKKNRNPNPSELLGKHTQEVDEVDEDEVGEDKAEAKAEVPKEASTLEAMVAQLPESIREKALEELRKLQVQAARNELAKAWVGFDTAIRDTENGLEKFIRDLAQKHEVTEQLAGRVLKITYPDGKFSYTNSPKGSRNGGGNGNRGGNGFKSQGKVLAIMLDGRKEEHSSLHAFAKFHHIKYEGRPTARIAVEDPWEEDKEGDSYPKHPYKHTIKDGENGTLLVTRVAR